MKDRIRVKRVESIEDILTPSVIAFLVLLTAAAVYGVGLLDAAIATNGFFR